MNFPERDLSNQFISRSYQDVVQQFLNTGSFLYLLDGYGNVIFQIPSSSYGGIILTQDQSASYALQALSASYAPGNPSISASYALSASYAFSSSYATTTSFALAFTPNSIKVISTSYSIVSGDYTIICNPTASITITLPDASLVNGQTFNIKKFDSSSTITITGSVTGQLIDNMGSQQITIQYTNIQIQSAGANDYYIL